MLAYRNRQLRRTHTVSFAHFTESENVLRALRLIGSMRMSLIRCRRVVVFVISTLCFTAAARVLTFRSTCSGLAYAYIFPMVSRAASKFSRLIMMRATYAVLSTCAIKCERVLTRLWEEEQEDELQGGRNGTKAYHPPPSSGHLLKASVDAVRDDLTASDRHYVHDHHAPAETCWGELLYV